MPRADEARSWWDEVQHLKPQTQQHGLAVVPTPEDRDERPAGPQARNARPRGTEAAAANAERRRARVADAPEPCLSRADASDFADAFDIEGAFGTPGRRFDRGEGTVIVLHRGGAAEDATDRYEDEVLYEDELAEEPYAADEATGYVDGEVELIDDMPARDPHTGRRTVRISGNPQMGTTPRRLRELDAPRRPRRSVAERAASSPDRIALYAVLLGLFLVVLAAASSGASA